MVAGALLRNSLSIEKWLVATTFVKYCAPKKLFPAISHKEKMFFRSNYFTLDHSAVVCYFSAYKLIGWDPEYIYLFKVNSSTLEK